MSSVNRRAFLGVTLGPVVARVKNPASGTNSWRELWNGRDLSGWETWLGRPPRSIQGLPLAREPSGDYVGPLGSGTDPLGVFTVVNVAGARVLRISGEICGAITTLEEVENFHLRVEWRWGEKRWAPRASERRDSGILYHCTGPHGASGPNHNWMRSLECQIQEADCGDYWSVGGVVADLRANVAPEAIRGRRPAYIWDPAGPLVTLPSADPTQEPRVRRRVDRERPRGQWNVSEVLARGADAEHKVNGETVLRIERARVRSAKGEQPLSRGKLQIQSECAEIFFRRIAIAPLT